MFQPNPPLVINLDRHERFDQTHLWLADLAVLQGALPPALLVDDPLVGSWRACNVEVVDPGHPEEKSKALTELEALYVLGDPGYEGLYLGVLENFDDVSTGLRDVVARHERLSAFCFSSSPALPDYSLLTLPFAAFMLGYTLDTLGEASFRAYKRWLAGRAGLPERARLVLERSPDWADAASFRRFWDSPNSWVRGPAGERISLRPTKAQSKRRRRVPSRSAEHLWLPPAPGK